MRNNISLLKTNQYFGDCDFISNIEEYRIVGAVSRERDFVVENFPFGKGRSDNLYRTRSRLQLPLGVPELIFVGLFHFAPIEVLRS